MKITQVRLLNYKSIQDSGKIDFMRISVLVGKNNTGKTAFIEALKGFFAGGLTLPRSRSSVGDGIVQSDPSHLEIAFTIEPSERASIFTGFSENLHGDQISFTLQASQNTTKVLYMRIHDEEDLTEEYRWDGNEGHAFTMSSTRDAAINANDIDRFVSVVFQNVIRQIAFISATRRPNPNQDPAYTPELNSDISNFHLVFHTLLTGRRATFDKIQEIFHSIFPEVRYVNPSMTGNTTNVHLEFEYGSEPIPLEQCGSGYPHVLAMLCMLYANPRQIILFDEPHLYLHPSAEKAIYDLLAKDHVHQFILTTHSPILVNYGVEKSVHLVKKEKGQTKISSLTNVTEALRDIGVMNSYFALSDKVIFVEGPTEVSVLPIILACFGAEQLGFNYTVINLWGTGDEYKSKKMMERNAKMYEELFKRISASPIPYRILLDRDERNVHMLREFYGEQILILGRREIENYFLKTEAIVEVFGTVGVNVTESEVKAFLETSLKSHADRKLFPRGSTDEPIVEIVGSEVLERIFSHYHVVYSKPKHGRMFTQWFVEHAPEDLKEIATLLVPFLQV